MSLKKFIEDKKQDWDKYNEKKDAIRQEKERNASIKLKLDAQQAQVDMAKLEEENKQRKQIADYKELKLKSKPKNKFVSAMESVSDFATKIDSGSKGDNGLKMNTPRKESGSIFGDLSFGQKPSGNNDMFSGVFGAPKKRKK